MRKFLLALSLISSVLTFAQMPGGGRPGGGAGRMMGGNMNMGHLYGKVVDSKTNKGIESVTVQLLGNQFDTATKQMSQKIVKTVLSDPRGNFSLENLQVFGKYQLKISAIGYKTLTEATGFDIKMPAGGTGGGAVAGAGMESLLNMVDKDLGNLKLEADAANLGNVTVSSTRQLFEMGVDRKIFNVDRNLTSTGQTATEVMKSIPSLSVDIDGNVTMRNSTPQLFVDGRPTTLTMDQIPADIIDRVELITNPSAKFDASGGNAGILNIVLKKNRKTGYNGGVRAGVDSRGAVNGGGDINYRQGKLNFFANTAINQRISKGTSTNDATYLNLNSPLRIYQTSNPNTRGLFAFGRGGFDYFMDNRNTLSVTGSYVRGNFKNDDQQHIDSVKNTNPTFNLRSSNSEMHFKNLGGQLSFRHNFAKNGHDWTADANYNKQENTSDVLLNTNTFSAIDNNPKYSPISQKTSGTGKSTSVVIQSDYENPITDNQKIEAGARASIRDVDQANNQFFATNGGAYVLNNRVSSNYKFTDKVYAAYATYSLKVGKWSYQFGLRAESSNYDGRLVKNDSSFTVDYPLSLFPSIFTTYKISDKEDLQVNYSRKINRPNFFQLLPFYDYSDPQNISIGNPGLKPEFTNSFEVSYNNAYKKGSNFLVSAFGKYNTNLITRYQYYGVNPDLSHAYTSADSLPINTYINANSSYTYGLELTNRMTVTKWWDNTINLNLFNSTINYTDPTGKVPNSKNQRTSWFAKTNNTFKISKTVSVQFSGEYNAKTVLPQEGGRGGGGGGRGGGGGMMMWGGGMSGTSQGYINPRYGFDLALRKDFTWKGGNTASITLSMNDIFRTMVYSTYMETGLLNQTSERRRDPQIARLNFNWRFGKFDVSLFKRKNSRSEEGGSDMMMGQKP